MKFSFSISKPHLQPPLQSPPGQAVRTGRGGKDPLASTSFKGI